MNIFKVIPHVWKDSLLAIEINRIDFIVIVYHCYEFNFYYFLKLYTELVSFEVKVRSVVFSITLKQEAADSSEMIVTVY